MCRLESVVERALHATFSPTRWAASALDTCAARGARALGLPDPRSAAGALRSSSAD